MEIQCTLKNVLPVVERGDFKSRKIWVTTADNPEYPQTLELEVSGKSLEIFNNIAPGANITCHVNLRGREWVNPDKVKNPSGNATVFNTIQCWRVEAAGSQQAPQTNGAAVELPDTNDLPF